MVEDTFLAGHFVAASQLYSDLIDGLVGGWCFAGF